MRRGFLDRDGRRHRAACRWPNEWRVGYHTTAAHNVDSIMRDGLIPYALHKPDHPEQGIWLWIDDGRDDMDRCGVIMQRVLDHQTLEVAKLDVWWPRCAEWGGCDSEYAVWHRGTFTGNKGVRWEYHDERPARIVVEPIPPTQIKVLAVYDLRAVLEHPRVA